MSSGCTDSSTSIGSSSSSREAEVAERGASVMPFDLERTTHRFSKADTGGVQTVVADDAQDNTQISLIREHLTAEAERFRRGDFTDPASIHGVEMPGLDTLRTHGGRITIDYETIPDGARITYATDDITLRDALHHWFDAQVTDHGRHATS
ncbi:hypothetical protein ADK67_41995 [Saccharothrix sp. NRRL B-16348]|nr:hypothetical protein ADK67_41995 [Saccharothrix sp. NRRL B-16348]